MTEIIYGRPWQRANHYGPHRIVDRQDMDAIDISFVVLHKMPDRTGDTLSPDDAQHDAQYKWSKHLRMPFFFNLERSCQR